MSNSETKANWHEIDPSTLQGDVAKAYGAYKAQYATAKTTREKFEEALRNSVELPKGQRLAISYHFGKLSVASVVDEGKVKSISAKATSLMAAFGTK